MKNESPLRMWIQEWKFLRRSIPPQGHGSTGEAEPPAQRKKKKAKKREERERKGWPSPRVHKLNSEVYTCSCARDGFLDLAVGVEQWHCF